MEIVAAGAFLPTRPFSETILKKQKYLENSKIKNLLNQKQINLVSQADSAVFFPIVIITINYAITIAIICFQSAVFNLHLFYLNLFCQWYYPVKESSSFQHFYVLKLVKCIDQKAFDII